MSNIIEVLDINGDPFYEKKDIVMNLSANELKQYDKAIPLLSKEYGKFYLVPDAKWFSIIDAPGFIPEEIKILQKMEPALREKTITAKMIMGGIIEKKEKNDI
jgi:hypothetical protein